MPNDPPTHADQIRAIAEAKTGRPAPAPPPPAVRPHADPATLAALRKALTRGGLIDDGPET
jgi:hypothetical protein